MMNNKENQMQKINQAVEVIGNVAETLKTNDYMAKLDIIKRARKGLATKAEIKAIETVVEFNHVFFNPQSYKLFKLDCKSL